jgi:hypothetical protein
VIATPDDDCPICEGTGRVPSEAWPDHPEAPLVQCECVDEDWSDDYDDWPGRVSPRVWDR